MLPRVCLGKRKHRDICTLSEPVPHIISLYFATVSKRKMSQDVALARNTSLISNHVTIQDYLVRGHKPNRMPVLVRRLRSLQIWKLERLLLFLLWRPELSSAHTLLVFRKVHECLDLHAMLIRYTSKECLNTFLSRFCDLRFRVYLYQGTMKKKMEIPVVCRSTQDTILKRTKSLCTGLFNCWRGHLYSVVIKDLPSGRVSPTVFLAH